MQNIMQRLIATTVLASFVASPMGAMASSHREAPSIAGSARVDGTDFYMFRSYESGRQNHVTLLANYNPLQDSYGGPNYFAMDPNAVYDINIDNNGDAKPDMIFRFQFDQALPSGGNGIAIASGAQQTPIALKNVGPISAGNNANLNFHETYTLRLITGNDVNFAHFPPSSNVGTLIGSFTKPYDYVGDKTFGSAAGYDAYAHQYIYPINLPGCAQPGKVFVGQRKEGFAVNLGKVFDLVNLIPIQGGQGGFPGGITQSADNNIVGDKNITSLALEVPTTCLTGTGNGVIGGWTTASLQATGTLLDNPTIANPENRSGFLTQVSRLGMPLVNEVVIGIKDKDRFNASKPTGDAQFASYVTNPSFPEILNALFKAPVNATLGTSFPTLAPTNLPRTDLVATFLTGLQGVNQLKTVTPSEMLRLNTAIAITPVGSQHTLGVIAGDNAGFPNGRRPGDDVTDIVLRVAMGKLCHLGLGLCSPAHANTGQVDFTDGAPVSAADFNNAFPYLKTPISGSSY